MKFPWPYKDDNIKYNFSIISQHDVLDEKTRTCPREEKSCVFEN